MQTKWATLCAERIRTGTLTEAQMRKMRSLIRRAYMKQRYPYMHASVPAADADELMQLIWDHTPQVSDAQAAKGVAWLRSVAYTPTGRRRNTDAAREFSSEDLTALEQCTHAPRFSLVDIDLDSFAPVYRAYGANGAFFDYVAAAWQSGGQFEIINRGA